MMKGDKIIHMEIIVPKMVVAPLSATLTRLTFSIDIVVHLFIKLPVVTRNLDSTSTMACCTDCYDPHGLFSFLPHLLHSNSFLSQL